MFTTNWEAYSPTIITEGSPCVSSSKWLTYYRLYAVSAMVWITITCTNWSADGDMYLTYLTRWQWITVLVYFIMAFIFSNHDSDAFETKTNKADLTWTFSRRAVVVMYQLSLSMAVCVTIAYFVLLYVPASYMCNFQCQSMADCNSSRYPGLKGYTNVTCSQPIAGKYAYGVPKTNFGFCSVAGGVTPQGSVDEYLFTPIGFGGVTCKNDVIDSCGLGGTCANRGNTNMVDDMTAHVLNSVFILGELFLNRIPLFKSHTIYVVIYAVIYTLVNFAYVQITGKVIYGILDWKTYESLVYAIAVLVLALIVVCAGCGVEKGKEKCEGKCHAKEELDVAMSPSPSTRDPLVVEIQ
jgi:hypothetical protein